MQCTKVYTKWRNGLAITETCGRHTKHDSGLCGYHRKCKVVSPAKEIIVQNRNDRPMIAGKGINITERLMKLPVKKRFGYIEKAVNMVIRGANSQLKGTGISGLMICGMGGIGKTHLVIETLNKAGLVQGEDWWKNSGKCSALGLYQLLFEHRDGGIVVLDDTDLWNDKEAMNIVKAALDTYGERTVSWNTKGAEQSGLPRSFVTKASVIFITNRDERAIPQPVKDRCIYIPLQVTRNEMFERMEEVLPEMEPKECPMATKREVLDYLREVRLDTDDPISLRTLFMAIRWRLNSDGDDDDWRECIDLFV